MCPIESKMKSGFQVRGGDGAQREEGKNNRNTGCSACSSKRGTIPGFDRSRNKKQEERGKNARTGRPELATNGRCRLGPHTGSAPPRPKRKICQGIPARCCRPLTPDLAQFVTRSQHCSSCLCTCSMQRHARAVGRRDEGMVPSLPPSPTEKEVATGITTTASATTTTTTTTTNLIMTCP
jgi:hypothetical protein